jgi:adenylosuccinate synthase
MPAIVVIGSQWGDEGKGRVIDLLARKARVIARYSAGNNAGHTILNDKGEFQLNLVPAGIFYPSKACIIGNGVAVDPAVLLNEINQLEKRGISTQKLSISERCQVIMPWHRLLDGLDEKLRGSSAIGTTGKGVGPCFADKVARRGIRIADLLDTEHLKVRITSVLEYENRLIEKVYGGQPIEFEETYSQYCEYGAQLKPFIQDTQSIITDALQAGEYVLLEGAQGALLDLDHGTYEFVTSSVPSSTAGGATIGVGIGPTAVERVIGVFKSYCTRVGNGPFPTELIGDLANQLRDHGKAVGRGEYGTTTGRPRRIGWLDAVAGKYSVRFNTLSAAALTRLDVLDGLPSIKICTAYKLDDEIINTIPASARALQNVEPIYEELPGWNQPTSGIRDFDQLPKEAKDYILRVEELLGVPIDLISVGPEREQAIIVNPVF